MSTETRTADRSGPPSHWVKWARFATTIVAIAGVLATVAAKTSDVLAKEEEKRKAEVELEIKKREVEIEDKKLALSSRETLVKELEAKLQGDRFRHEMALRLLDEILKAPDDFYPQTDGRTNQKKRSLVLGAFPRDVVTEVFDRAALWSTQSQETKAAWQNEVRQVARNDLRVVGGYTIQRDLGNAAVQAARSLFSRVAGPDHDDTGGTNLVKAPEVRFYQPGDKGAAEQLAELLHKTPGLESTRVVDAAYMVPRPVHGLLEIWVP